MAASSWGDGVCLSVGCFSSAKGTSVLTVSGTRKDRGVGDGKRECI